MTGYQIDDVYELFASDMARFLGDLDTRAGELRTGLATIHEQTAGLERVQDALAISCHAVAGTSALVSVDSSRAVAIRLESLVHDLGGALRALLDRHQQLARLREACDAGVDALRAVVTAELAGRRAEAQERSRDAVAEVDRIAARPALAAVPAGAEDGPSEDPSEVAERAELIAVFRAELAQALDEAGAHLDAIEHGPDRAGALARLASILHMMKGAAASVGEAALAIELRSVYEIVEDFVDRGELPEPAAARRLRAELAGLAAPGPGPEIDPQKVFRAEAGPLLAQVRARHDELARDPAVRAELGRIFHRIKGSALVVDLPDIARLAEALEHAARHDRPIERSAIDRLAAVLDGGGDGHGGARPDAAPVPAREAPRGTREAVPDLVTGELWESFVEESGELLDAIERGVGELQTAASPGTVTALLGVFHTLKGAANTVGLSPVGRELHAVETLLERLGDTPSPARAARVAALLVDVLVRLRRNIRGAAAGHVDCAAERVAYQAERLADGSSVRSAGSTADADDAPRSESWLGSHDSAWSTPDSEAGRDRGSARDDSRDDSRDDQAGGSAGAPAAAAARAPAERRFVRVAVDRLDGMMNMIGELIVSRSRMTAGLTALSALQREHETRRRRLTEIVESFTDQAEFANLGGQRRRAAGARAVGGFGALEFDVYEEVHVLARRLAEASSDVGDSSAQFVAGIAALGTGADELGGIVSKLQGQIHRARMVPLDSVFSRVALSVRDAAERDRKRVEVTVAGADVVIDKAIADNLYAPLLHLVRNAVAHGIEPAGARRERGKPEHGTIALSARQDAGEIVIQIADDGAGLDLAALHREGVARQLIAPGVPVTAPEVAELVFAPGVTTSEISNLAGRGMGGDVARRMVQRLGGSIQVSSERGRGVSFRLRLPVTLAITRAVIVRQGDQLFGIPLLFVERIVPRGDVRELPGDGQRRIQHDKDLLSVFRVHPDGPPGHVFLLCGAGGRRVAIEADAVVAYEDAVVKKLGHVLDGHPMFLGTSQRGDGELALVLDVNGVLERHARRAVAPARPVAPVAVRPVTPVPVAADPPRAVATAAAMPRVLFVDDSLSVRKVAEATLRKLGVTVITASDGRDALDRLREHPASLVFTDLEMPRMHGFELMQEMRVIPAYRAIPIVVVSSRSGDKHVAKAMEAGANDYLTKPFSEDTLGRMLGKLVPGYRRPG